MFGVARCLLCVVLCVSSVVCCCLLSLFVCVYGRCSSFVDWRLLFALCRVRFFVARCYLRFLLCVLFVAVRCLLFVIGCWLLLLCFVACVAFCVRGCVSLCAVSAVLVVCLWFLFILRVVRCCLLLLIVTFCC